MKCRLVREVPELAGVLPRPLDTSLRPRAWLAHGGLVNALGESLDTVGERRLLSTIDDPRLLDANADLTAVAVAGGGRFEIHDAAREPHVLELAVDEATFLHGGGLLVTAPGEPPDGKVYPVGHRVIRLDDRGEVVRDFAVAEVWDAAGILVRHPSEPAVVVELAMGQDGSVAHVADLSDGDLTLRPLEIEDACVTAFSPDGSRLLLGAHPNHAALVRVLDWRRLDEVGRLETEDVGWIDEGLSHVCGFVGDDRILVYAIEQGLVLTDGWLREPRLLELPGIPKLGDEADIVWLYPVTGDRFAVGLWTQEGQRTLLYSFA